MKVYVVTHDFGDISCLQHRGCFAELKDALEFADIKPTEVKTGIDESGQNFWRHGLSKATEMEVR